MLINNWLTRLLNISDVKLTPAGHVFVTMLRLAIVSLAWIAVVLSISLVIAHFTHIGYICHTTNSGPVCQIGIR